MAALRRVPSGQHDQFVPEVKGRQAIRQMRRFVMGANDDGEPGAGHDAAALHSVHRSRAASATALTVSVSISDGELSQS